MKKLLTDVWDEPIMEKKNMCRQDGVGKNEME